jgi:2'-5' RNA ligase
VVSPPFSSSFEEAREAFGHVSALRLFDGTSDYEFTHGRAQYLAFLIRLESQPARDYVATAQQRLAGIPGLEFFPPEYLHMSIKGAGFQVIKRTLPDDVLRGDVPRIAAEARRLLAPQRAFEARLGALAGFPEVAFIEVHDDGRIRELNNILYEGCPLLPRYPVDGASFLPHVSIARFTSNQGLPQLKETFATHCGERGPAVLVSRIEFVKVWLSGALPEFETLATYPLRG